jgi:hypothetical protein
MLTYHMTGNKVSSTAVKGSSSSNKRDAQALQQQLAHSPQAHAPHFPPHSDELDGSLLIGQGGQTYRQQLSSHPFSILVFDLKSAGKWRILEGHQADVTAVSFHPSGTHVASYCARDGADGMHPTLRLWKLGESGLFSDLIHSHGKCVRTWPLIPCDLRAAVTHEQQIALNLKVVASHRRASTALKVDNASLTAPVSAMQAYQAQAAGHTPVIASPGPSPPVVTHEQLPSRPAPVRVVAASTAVTAATASASPSTPPRAAAGAPSAASAATHAPLSRSISCASIEDDVDDEASIIAGRMLGVRLGWKGDLLILTREDKSVTSFECKV